MFFISVSAKRKQNRMKKIRYLWLVLLCLSTWIAQAQDPHFSQIVNTPVLLNPALTGLMGTDMRIQTNYRTQWATVATPFQTMSFAIDFSPLKYIFNTDDMLGMGMYVLRDKAGLTELSNTQIQLNVAYSKSLTGEGNNYLSIGGQAGYVHQRLNIENLTFDNQIQGNVLNTSLASGEDNIIPSRAYWDASVGISWAYAPEKSESYYLGASIFHVNAPLVGFVDSDNDLLYRKYTAYAGSEFRLNYLISMMPRAYFFKQGPAKEFTAGTLVKFNIENARNRYDSSAFMLGAMYRVGDAIIVVSRYDFDVFGISFSYDVNVSGLNNVSRNYGAMEVALSYKTNLSQRRGYGRPLSCPNF